MENETMLLHADGTNPMVGWILLGVCALVLIGGLILSVRWFLYKNDCRLIVFVLLIVLAVVLLVFANAFFGLDLKPFNH